MNNCQKPSQSNLSLHQSLFFLIFSSSLLLSTVTAKTISARPLCYLIDANGNQINLSDICGQSKKTATIQEKQSSTLPTPSQNSPSNINPNQANTITPENSANTGNATPNSQNTTDAQKEEEIDTTEFPPAQRKIPLLQNQRKEQIIDEQ
ncbi:hypothetical protein [Cyanobacterium sp. Dongsha4]|uniref:hypothetical protein n=1 Tax=Cyanobacterium sp. DS4 TaxID=2878255 RepID=UPI002E812B39|nr:hypothetical protein [Cyanobacterium sp. Dongsha4]WVL00129.1 hypothetical protein Dongsha4_15955 [Cyanobacterium sp. Dongsha4]